MRRTILLIALLAAANTPALAQTVYKSVDKDGNVTYSENPPAGKTQVREVPIDPNQNVIPSEKPAHIEALEAEQRARAARQREEAAAEEPAPATPAAQAEAALRQAEEALAAGQAAQPGDFIGRADGGVGPSPQRLERIHALQEAVEAARRHLEQVR